MNANTVVIQGLVKPDGSLELEGKVPLPPGRVTVVLRQEVELDLPKDDPFWQRMQAMWDLPQGTTPRGGAESEAELRRMRDEWDEHQQVIERLQDEGRQGPKP